MGARRDGDRKQFGIAQKCAAELLGTFVITAAAMSVDILFFAGAGVSYTARWLARGAATAAVIYAFAEASGAHVDPAITLGFLLRGIFPRKLAVLYWAAQFAGSFAAAALLLLVFGTSVKNGASHPSHGYSHLTAFFCEIVLTALVMLTILLTANDRAEVGRQSALAVGLAVALCGLCAGPISGASMNPARSIAPQILSGRFDLIWIYALGPCIGAALAVGIQRFLCGPPNLQERKAAQG
jgi:aquaporin Z